MAAPRYVIDAELPTAADVQALLARHWELMRASSPPEDTHYLDTAGLLAPDVTFVTARATGLDDPAGTLLAIGALKELDPGHGELKSMHTPAEHRGRGLGAAMVEHLVQLGRRRGYRRLSLETGSMAAFAAARALYARAGFLECGPFADYAVSPNTAFMTLEL